MKFKVGDRVKHIIFGNGTVKVIRKNFTCNIGVEFDISCCPFSHDLKYNGKSFSSPNHGLWCPKDSLRMIEDETIVIEQNDNIMIAYMGQKHAVAKCSPKDKLDLYKGAVLALTRLLLEGEENGGGKKL